MKDNVCLDNSIEALKVNDNILNILTAHQINSIRDLWQLNRKKLKNMSLTDNEINQIIIKMQLSGIDLNKKIYNKD